MKKVTVLVYGFLCASYYNLETVIIGIIAFYRFLNFEEVNGCLLDD